MEKSRGSRTWFATLNNPGEDSQQLLESLVSKKKATWTLGQLEQGQEGTPHLQFMLHKENASTLSAMKKLSGRAHWEECRDPLKSIDYVSKESTRLAGPWEYG